MTTIWQSNEECVGQVAALVQAKQKDKRTTSDTKISVAVGTLLGVLGEVSDLNTEIDGLNRQLSDAMSLDITGRPRVHQDKFGSVAGHEDTGNCFQVCLATVLGCHVDVVPHFYSIYGEDNLDEANRAIGEFLGQNGYQMAFYDAEVMAEGLRGGWVHAGTGDNKVVVIVTGDSPRGNWKHAVVGVLDPTAPDNWTLLHDPHPSGAGIVKADGFEIISKTVRIKV